MPIGFFMAMFDVDLLDADAPELAAVLLLELNTCWPCCLKCCSCCCLELVLAVGAILFEDEFDGLDEDADDDELEAA